MFRGDSTDVNGNKDELNSEMVERPREICGWPTRNNLNYVILNNGRRKVFLIGFSDLYKDLFYVDFTRYVCNVCLTYDFY